MDQNLKIQTISTSNVKEIQNPVENKTSNFHIDFTKSLTKSHNNFFKKEQAFT